MSSGREAKANPSAVGALAAAQPGTTLALVCIVALGVATRALWSTDAAGEVTSRLGYGLPALLDGRWWTIATGGAFAVSPLGYVPVLVGLLVVGGFAERRLGTARALAVATGCHVVAVVGAAGLLALLRLHGWDWAVDLSGRTDAGPSAAFLGAAAAGTAGVAPPWRGRLRAGLTGYVVLSVLYLGGLADVEHAIAVAAGLLLGPVLLLGRRPGSAVPSSTRRDRRWLASRFLVVSSIATAVSGVSPVNGPLTGAATEARHAAVAAGQGLPGGIALHAVLFLVLARAVARGTRSSWRVATIVVALVTVAQLLAVGGIVIHERSCWPGLVDNAALNVAGLVILLLARRSCANPSRRRSARHRDSLHWAGDASERVQATACLGGAGSVSRLAWMTTWPDNRWFFGRARRAFIAHRIHAGVALGVGDPVGPASEGSACLLAEFASRARSDGLVPCLFGVTEETRAVAVRELGWRSVQVAEEAVIDLAALELRGKAWQDVRTALNQASKRGIDVQLGALAAMPAVVRRQVGEISALWVRDKGLPELGLTLGGVEEALDPRVRVAVAVDPQGTVHGVTSWMPVHRAGDGRVIGWTLDLMRRRPDGFRGVMELLIATSLLTFRDEGAELVSLSAAPLARVSTEATGGAVDGFLDRIAAELEPLYGFRSLHAFKSKFQPRYEPLHLVFPDESALPRIAVALTRAYLPGAGWRQLVDLLRRRTAAQPVVGLSPTAQSIGRPVVHGSV